MKQDLPWSVSGIPPEARDVARAAANRDGVSVGDWITRRILGETARALSASDRGTPVNHQVSYKNERDEETRRDREDLVQRLAKTEAETDGAFRRIDETLRAVARRMETTERSQNEAQRAMSAAAAEITVATREQAQAFDHLNKRIDSVEQQSDNSALRDAVRGLHQGLSRLADQIAKTATEASGQVGMIASNVETLANKVSQVRDEANLGQQITEGRLSALSERMRISEERLDSDPRSGEFDRIAEIVQSLERTIDSIADRLAATEMLAINFARVETVVDGTEARMQDAMARHLTAIEGNLAAIGERIEQSEKNRGDADASVQEAIATFGIRIDTGELHSREIFSEIKALNARTDTAEARNDEILAAIKALGARIDAAEGHNHEVFAEIKALGARIDTAEGHNHEVFAEITALGERIDTGEDHDREVLAEIKALGARIDTGEVHSRDVFAEIRALGARIDTGETRNRDAFAELKKQHGDTAKRVDSIEQEASMMAPYAPAPGYFAPPPSAPAPESTYAPSTYVPPPSREPSYDDPDALPEPSEPPPPPAEAAVADEPAPEASAPPAADFDLPPFSDAPPFPGGTFAPHPADDYVPPPALASGEVYAADGEQPVPPVAQDYLAAARRAAQASSASDGARTSAMGTFRPAETAETPSTGRSNRVPLIVAVVVLMLVALIAGIVLMRNSGSSTPAPAPVTSGVDTPATAPGDQATDLTVAPPAPEDVAPTSGAAPSPSEDEVARDNAPVEPLNRHPMPPVSSAQQVATTAPVAAPSGPQRATPTPMDRLLSSAKAGNAKAQLLLGLRYLDGDGVAASDSEAVRWLRKAAEQGDAVAQYRLGTMYERGRGVSVDPRQAKYWYGQAAAHGNRKAMHNLAVAYAEGSGAEKNYGEAARWFKAAAALGLTDSQFNLAVLYERGLGVGQSLTEAYKWYSVAGAQGDTESRARIEVLNTQLSAADRTAAAKAAHAFHPKSMDRDANEAPELAQVAP